jgi:hypothetical protein
MVDVQAARDQTLGLDQASEHRGASLLCHTDHTKKTDQVQEGRLPPPSPSKSLLYLFSISSLLYFSEVRFFSLTLRKQGVITCVHATCTYPPCSLRVACSLRPRCVGAAPALRARIVHAASLANATYTSHPCSVRAACLLLGDIGAWPSQQRLFRRD